MPTLSRYNPKVRPARAYPTPKRKPARLSSEQARAGGHNVRKARSR
ncbi:MAG TPA: hypothetical protein VMU12_01350 [Candidatus Paceibacterota bacterium]|nr:hypothetical protein [Candidatus Paceibacterota bacterium]